MSSRVKHLFIVGSMLELFACSKEDPCDENPNLIICLGGDTETGGSGDLVDALARAKRAGLPELLESLSRDDP